VNNIVKVILQLYIACTLSNDKRIQLNYNEADLRTAKNLINKGYKSTAEKYIEDGIDSLKLIDVK